MFRLLKSLTCKRKGNPMIADSMKMLPKEYDIMVRFIEIHLNKIRGESDINELAETSKKSTNPDIAFFEKLIDKIKLMKQQAAKTDKLELISADEMIFREDGKVTKRIQFKSDNVL